MKLTNFDSGESIDWFGIRNLCCFTPYSLEQREEKVLNTNFFENTPWKVY
jgi:hypothetical protein